MQSQRKLSEKLIASILVFCLTLTNFAGLGLSLVSYASDAQSSVNGNITFSAGIVTKDVQKQTSYTADVKDENLAIVVNTGVNTNGYLKSPVIEVENLDSQIFRIKQDAEFSGQVIGMDGNKIYLNQITSGMEVEIQIPIEYKSEEESIDVTKLNSTINIKLHGTYIDNEGNGVEIEGNSPIQLGWKTDSAVTVSSNVEKYVPYVQDGISYALLQLKVNANVGESTDALPVKDTNITLSVPEISGATLSSVGVSAINTGLTNGLQGDAVSFSNENWKFDENNKTISIGVSNIRNEETGKYAKPTGNDEYVVTLIYSNVALGDNTLLSGNIALSQNVFSAEGDKNISGESVAQYDLSEQTGSIVTYSVTGQTETVSKGNIYANYNLDNNYYETEYSNLFSINVSRPDAVKIIEIRENEEYFTDKDGEKLNTTNNDRSETYYKSLKINKDNLVDILGDEGSMIVLDEANKELVRLTSETVKDINEVVELNFNEDSVSKVVIQITKPAKEGILNIVGTKAIGKLSYNKLRAISLESLTDKFTAKAQYTGDVITDLDTITTKVNFTGTKSNATLSLSRNELSTLVKNENVEMSISLNNYNDTTDLYKNPVFELTFPKEVKEIKVKTMNVLYGNDELKVEKVDSYKDEDGNIVLRVKVIGTQTKYSMVDAADGTTIILNSDITLDKYETSGTKSIKMNYYNESATEYSNSVAWSMESERTKDTLLSNCGEINTVLKVVAPDGVVSAEEVIGYNEENENVYSINQGDVSATIGSYTKARAPKMRITMLNNSEDKISDVSILGRTGFVGNKSIVSNEDLGTTVDAIMLTELSKIADANKEIKVYYSENPTATRVVSDEANGWKESMETYSNVKSYLIVVKGDVEPGEVIAYDYRFSIPADLSANNSIVAPMATYYKVGDEESISEANKVVLKTVDAPELSVETTSDAGDEIKEGQVVTYTVTVTNNGKAEAVGVAVTSKIEEGTKYLEKNEDGTYSIAEDIKDLKLEIGTIPAGESKSVSYKVKVDEKAADEIEKPNTEEPKEEQKEDEEAKIASTSQVEAEGLEEPIYTQSKQAEVKPAEIKLTLSEIDYVSVVKEGKRLEMNILADTNKAVKNLRIDVKLPNGVSFDEAYTQEFDNNVYEGEKIDCATYDEATRTVTYTFDSLTSSRYFKLITTVDDISEEERDIVFKATATADGVDTYESNELTHKISKPSLEVSYVSSSNDKYVKDGAKVQYVLTIKNTSKTTLEDGEATTTVPNGLKISSATYRYNNKNASQLLVRNDGKITSTLTMEAGSTVTITLDGYAENTTKKELPVANAWTIETNEIGTLSTDKISQIVQPKVTKTVSVENTKKRRVAVTSTTKTPTTTTRRNTTTTARNTTSNSYKITGKAWNDSNEDGSRNSSEKGLPGVVAKLYDAKTNKAIQKVSTDGSGNYVFANLGEGNYYIVFGYNTSKYKLTDYHKEGVNSSSNSDVVLTNSLAITDTITLSGSSQGDIDIGLIESKMFDLSLSKTITKATVQSNSGTKKYDFNHVTTGKVDIRAKDMASAKVYVEYAITVMNKGELKGYARSIVDYVPEGMSFNPELNREWGWYVKDGKLYTSALAKTPIEAGRSATIKLVLTKQMTTESTGVFSNGAEIASSFNEAAIADTDSKAGNAVASEDDYGTADMIISVNTGGGMVNVMVLLTTLITLFVALWVMKLNVDRKNKGVMTWED